jgi:hypothetical protein
VNACSLKQKRSSLLSSFIVTVMMNGCDGCVWGYMGDEFRQARLHMRDCVREYVCMDAVCMSEGDKVGMTLI